MTRGLFITLEGGEGAGKTTQARRLKTTLEEQGYDVVLTREPGGTPEAEKIRDLLVQKDGGNWTPLAECALFFAARQMHVENLIKPSLQKDKIVISDRFTDSTRAYQGYGHGFDLEKIEAMNTLMIGDFKPDLTLIFDLPIETGLERSFAQKKKSSGAESTEDRFEHLNKDFHEKMRQGFLSIAKSDQYRCKIVDATGSPDEIFQIVLSIVQGKLNAVR